jgi:hypothetical protein
VETDSIVEDAVMFLNLGSAQTARHAASPAITRNLGNVRNMLSGQDCSRRGRALTGLTTPDLGSLETLDGLSARRSGGQ